MARVESLDSPLCLLPSSAYAFQKSLKRSKHPAPDCSTRRLKRVSRYMDKIFFHSKRRNRFGRNCCASWYIHPRWFCLLLDWLLYYRVTVYWLRSSGALLLSTRAFPFGVNIARNKPLKNCARFFRLTLM